MKLTLKTKIWLTILTIVLMFSFFTLYYFPNQQSKLLLSNYKNEVQNLANTVSLGVKIAMTEQNYEGVQTALDFVKSDPRLEFISILQTDSIWNTNHTQYKIEEKLYLSDPIGTPLAMLRESNDSIIVKKSAFVTPVITGSILVGFSTKAINAAAEKIKLTSLLVSGMVSILGVIIGLWLSKKISRPVLALRDAAVRVGQGNFDQKVEISTGDEIAELSMAFNKMVEDLSCSTKKLSETNQTLETTNTALNKTLLDLKATQTQLIQSEKMASLGELTAGIAHEIQNPLNFINNFSEVSCELIDEMEEELRNGNKEDAIACAADIKQNLEKISHHGKRADGIVKSMLQHSRLSTGQKTMVDINLLVDEYLRLSYHGLRAKDKTFNAALETHFDENVGKANIIGQDIGRVLLNIFNNAFYSVLKKKQQCAASGYEPRLIVETKKEKSDIVIRIHDNGIGIPKTLIDKVYQPFFTTKPTGEGTGLGLSLSYDIITKSHNGSLKFDTQEGEYAEFFIRLPIL